MAEIIDEVVTAQGANLYWFGEEGVRGTCFPELAAISISAACGVVAYLAPSPATIEQEIEQPEVTQVSRFQSSTSVVDAASRVITEAQATVSAVILQSPYDTLNQHIETLDSVTAGMVTFGACAALTVGMVRGWRATTT